MYKFSPSPTKHTYTSIRFTHPRTFSFRSLSKNYTQPLTTDSSSSEYQSTDSSSPSKLPTIAFVHPQYNSSFSNNSSLEKSASLLSRLFRRSGRSKQKNLQTYSGQFPPAEWFNSKAVHLHSIGTQTEDGVSNELLSWAVTNLKFSLIYYT